MPEYISQLETNFKPTWNKCWSNTNTNCITTNYVKRKNGTQKAIFQDNCQAIQKKVDKERRSEYN